MCETPEVFVHMYSSQVLLQHRGGSLQGSLLFCLEDGVNCWVVDDLSIRQADDGFVMVEKSNSDGSRAFLRVSPTNGKLKVWTPSVQVSSLFTPGL